MKASERHHEVWSVFLEREEGDDWPDMPSTWRESEVIRPVAIFIEITRGARHPSYSVRGRILRQDGTPGQRKGHAFGSAVPDWAREICEQDRRDHDLGPEKTGVSW